MDWRTVHFDWNRARSFLVTAEEGSFSKAARALDVAQPTIGRQVAALESELGVVLFRRVGKRLELTEAGMGLIEHVRVMGEAAARVSLTATGQAEALEGSVAITASEAVAAFLLPPVIDALRREHPRIELDLVVSNSPRDLRRREADIAVRSFRSEQPDLIARRLPDTPAHLYATPGYLERIGFRGRDDLGSLELFAFDHTSVMVTGLAAVGLAVRPEQFPVTTGNHLVQWAMCQQGLGVCIMMEQVGDPDPSVVRVLPEHSGLPVPMWLACHRELRTSRRIRTVFDRLAEELSTRATRSGA